MKPILFFSILVLLTYCSQPSEQVKHIEFINLDGTASYVGDEACQSCHEEIYLSYQDHGMAQSFYQLTAENIVENFSQPPVYHEATDLYYRPLIQNGKYYQEEFRLDEAGKKVHSLLREMQYVIGSGNAARTYVTEINKRYYELPLTWYTQKGIFAFSPGYQENNQRFDRLISSRCVSCHNSITPTYDYMENKYQDVLKPIGCERCHGPGSLHIDARLESESFEGKHDKTILNPTFVALDQRLDICQQCHLQGTTSVLRAGQKAFDYVLTEPLSNHISLFGFSERTTSDAIPVISHADRMKKSACFMETLNSPSPMECTTCHDPHAGFRNKGTDYFVKACISCHALSALENQVSKTQQSNHLETSNCIECHMERKQSIDAPHASFTDHFIRIQQDSKETQKEESVTPFFERDQKNTIEASLYKGLAFAELSRKQGDKHIKSSLDIFSSNLTDTTVFFEALNVYGFLLAKEGKYQDAQDKLEQALRLQPKSPQTLATLAYVLEKQVNEPEEIIKLYEEALTLQPFLETIRLQYADYLSQIGRYNQAKFQYQEVLKENPTHATAFNGLGQIFFQENDSARAEKAFLEAIKLNPDLANALSNLAIIRMNQNAIEEASNYFGRAKILAPDDYQVQYNFGTFLLKQGKIIEGIAQMKQVLLLYPNHLGALENLVMGLLRTGKQGEAVQFAQRLKQLDPNNLTARNLLR